MKKIISILVALFISATVSAEDWYVCMGSFRQTEKAKERVQVLQDAGFSVFITKFTKAENNILYRVLFSEKFAAEKDAVFRRNELLKLSKIKKFGFTDLWCCRSDGNRVEEPSVQTFIPITKEVIKEVPTPVEKAPEKQTVVVKVNGIEEQRFDITSEDRLIKVNVNVDAPAVVPAASNVETATADSVATTAEPVPAETENPSAPETAEPEPAESAVTAEAEVVEPEVVEVEPVDVEIDAK